jgi:hypothetical protein
MFHNISYANETLRRHVVSIACGGSGPSPDDGVLAPEAVCECTSAANPGSSGVRLGERPCDQTNAAEAGHHGPGVLPGTFHPPGRCLLTAPSRVRRFTQIPDQCPEEHAHEQSQSL